MVFCVLLRKGWGCDALLPLVQVWPSKLDTRDVVSSACGLAELWQLATLFLSQWACPCRNLLHPMYLDLLTSGTKAVLRGEAVARRPLDTTCLSI